MHINAGDVVHNKAITLFTQLLKPALTDVQIKFEEQENIVDKLLKPFKKNSLIQVFLSRYFYLV